MKVFLYIFGTFFFLFCVGSIIYSSFYQFEGAGIYGDQLHDQLLTVSFSKFLRISDFLEQRKLDAVFLADNKNIKDIFHGVISDDLKSMNNNIRDIARQTAYEIDEYLVEHPEMTLQDLQNDDKFQSIAVRQIGELGYTAVFDTNNRVASFHAQSNRINQPLDEIRTQFPNLFNIINDSFGPPCRETRGFYLWEDPDGLINQKFLYDACVGGKTADYNGFVVSATVYIKEYVENIILVSEIDKELSDFRRIKGFSDLILINSDGDIIWTSEKDVGFGTNLISGTYNESLLADIFLRVKGDLDVKISDSRAYGEEGRLSIFVTAPVLDFNEVTGKEELIGIIALRLDNDKISELVATDVGLGEQGEVYIVNKDRNYITPLKFGRINASNYIIDSGRISSCFESHGNKNIEFEKNYAGMNAIGTYSYVPEFGWCIIAEVNEDEFFKTIPNVLVFSYTLMGIILFLVALIALFFESLFYSRRIK